MLRNAGAQASSKAIEIAFRVLLRKFDPLIYALRFDVARDEFVAQKRE